MEYLLKNVLNLFNLNDENWSVRSMDSVQLYWRLLETNRQTRQVYLYISLVEDAAIMHASILPSILPQALILWLEFHALNSSC